MSFATDLQDVMTNDSSINAYCEGGIHYENLPENFEITKDWIVYSFNKDAQQSCLGSTQPFTKYNIAIKIVATDTIELEKINDRLVTYLNGKTYSGIQDILFVGDQHSMDLDKSIYMNTLQFDAIYV